MWFSFIAAGTPSIGASSRLSSPRHSHSSPLHGSPRFTHHDMEWEDEFEFYDEGAPSRGCRCCFILLSLSLSCVASWPVVVVFLLLSLYLSIIHCVAMLFAPEVTFSLAEKFIFGFWCYTEMHCLNNYIICA